MALLDLPSEILIIVCESVPDIPTLYDLAWTCQRTQDLIIQNVSSIPERVAANTSSEFAESVKHTVNAVLSLGELDYTYQGDHQVQWIQPKSSKPPAQHGVSREECLARLKILADLINDIESLTQWCLPRCYQKSTWHCSQGSSLQDTVRAGLVQLQLVSNRLYNVRLPNFPEHVSLRTFESDRTKTYISRKARDQARDLLEDQLRPLDVHTLRNLWILMQILQDEYLLLRRHRLRPSVGSLMDLLFQHNSDEKVWSITPWFAVQNLLSSRGLHVVPARPGTAFRFLGHETNHELQQKDVAEYDRFMESLSTTGVGTERQQQCSICTAYRGIVDGCTHDYLERFRPLLGLPYRDVTPTKSLVRFRGSMQPIIVANCYWAYESTTKIDQTTLGAMLWQCAESNSTIRAAKRRNSSKPV